MRTRSEEIMQQQVTWLKFLIGIAAIMGVVFCIMIVPQLATEYTEVPVKPFLWISAIPFFIALVVAFQMCSSLVQKSFSSHIMNYLKILRALASTEALLYGIALLAIFILGKASTMLVVFCLLFLGMAIVLVVVLQMLYTACKEALQLEEEARLTI